jgi:hypothetical protein
MTVPISSGGKDLTPSGQATTLPEGGTETLPAKCWSGC